MLLLGFFLLSAMATAARHVERDNYVLTIDDNTLKDVRITGKSPDTLNLSNLGLEAVDPKAFANVPTIKALNLANNSLSNLPKSLLANFTNLEHLNLANNALNSGNFYQGLGNLRTLNISNNPVRTIESGHFFGLTRFANIITQGLRFRDVSATMFEDPSTVRRRLAMDWLEREQYKIMVLSDANYEEVEQSITDTSSNWDKNLGIKVCIHDGHLESLEVYEKDKPLTKGCHNVDHTYGRLYLERLGIKTFESGWYRLQDLDVRSLKFGYNEIAQLTREFFNGLPRDMYSLELNQNKIERLERGVIENSHRFVWLQLSDNRISEIEDGALENLNLTNWLSLNNNRLRNTKFLDSLSSHVRFVSLEKNNISEISPGNFSKFKHFVNLNLNHNNIMEVKSHRLRGFSSLMVLELSNNGLKRIEPGFFQDLKNLVTVDLASNSISTFEKGVFTGLEKIRHIYLYSNELTEIPNGVFTELPNSLETLAFSENRIERIKAGAFRNGPKILLDLTRNRISNIEKGSFDLPNLEALVLDSNFLKDVDGESFEGLGNLGLLSLKDNNITTLKRGVVKNLNHLFVLDLSENPIEVLEIGALFGLPKTADTVVDLHGVPVEIIKGGLFDEM